MSAWKDEADFMKDIESTSEFYISGNNNNNKFVYKSKKEKKPIFTPWYDESESEEEIDNYAFGRGKNIGNNTRDPGPELDHHEVMREIQRQVRGVVGNRYNNEVLESYYNVYMDEVDDLDLTTESRAPKEVSISYAREQKRLNTQKAAEKVAEQKTNLPVSPVASTSFSSPKKTGVFCGNRSKKRYGSRTYGNSLGQNQPDNTFPFSSPKKEMNVNSKEEFPPL